MVIKRTKNSYLSYFYLIVQMINLIYNDWSIFLTFKLINDRIEAYNMSHWLSFDQQIVKVFFSGIFAVGMP